MEGAYRSTADAHGPQMLIKEKHRARFGKARYNIRGAQMSQMPFFTTFAVTQDSQRQSLCGALGVRLPGHVRGKSEPPVGAGGPTGHSAASAPPPPKRCHRGQASLRRLVTNQVTQYEPTHAPIATMAFNGFASKMLLSCWIDSYEQE